MQKNQENFPYYEKIFPDFSYFYFENYLLPEIRSNTSAINADVINVPNKTHRVTTTPLQPIFLKSAQLFPIEIPV